MNQHWTRKLNKLGACEDAVEWARDYQTLEAAWAACRRGDWMLWLAARAAGEPGSESRRLVARAAAACARLALPAWKSRHPDDTTVEAAIVAAERGDPKECQKAAWAASASASAAAWAAWAASASAAAWAAWAESAAESAASASHDSSLAASSDIVRLHYPSPPVVFVKKVEEKK